MVFQYSDTTAHTLTHNSRDWSDAAVPDMLNLCHSSVA